MKSTFLIIIISILLCSCSNESKYYSVHIDDSADIFSNMAKKYIINNIKLPQDIVLVIKSVDRLPRGTVGSSALKLFENESYFDKVRHKGWIDRILGNTSRSTGIFILISRNSDLIQVRYGSQIISKAYYNKLAAGDSYLKKQIRYHRARNKDIELVKFVKWIVSGFAESKFPWYLNYLGEISGLTSSTFIDLAYPEEGIYTNKIFKPYIKIESNIFRYVKIFINKFEFKFIKPDIIHPIINGSIYWLVRFIIVNILIYFIFKSIFPEKYQLIQGVATSVVSIFISFPAVISIIMTLQGRAEDLISLKQLGIDINQLSLFGNSHLYGGGCPDLYIVFMVIFMITIVNITNSLYYFCIGIEPSKIQKRIFDVELDNNNIGTLISYAAAGEYASGDEIDQEPYKYISINKIFIILKSSIKWFVFMLLMPSAITSYLLIVYLIKMPWVIKKAFSQILISKRIKEYVIK